MTSSIWRRGGLLGGGGHPLPPGRRVEPGEQLGGVGEPALGVDAEGGEGGRGGAQLGLQLRAGLRVREVERGDPLGQRRPGRRHDPLHERGQPCLECRRGGVALGQLEQPVELADHGLEHRDRLGDRGVDLLLHEPGELCGRALQRGLELLHLRDELLELRELGALAEHADGLAQRHLERGQQQRGVDGQRLGQRADALERRADRVGDPGAEALLEPAEPAREAAPDAVRRARAAGDERAQSAD